MSNSGTSINFDAQAIHDAEEAEYHREEKERENELRAALLDAFDDDLSDEDSDVSHDHGLSLMSDESGNKAQTEKKRNHAGYDNDAEQTITNDIRSQVPASTPYMGHVNQATSGQTNTASYAGYHARVPYLSDNTMSPYPDHATSTPYTGCTTATQYADHQNVAMMHAGHANVAHIAEHVTSTPLNAMGAPPLATPASDHRGHGGIEWNQDDSGNNHNVHYPTYGDYQAGREQYFGDGGQMMAARPELMERGEIEGASENDAISADRQGYLGNSEPSGGNHYHYGYDYQGNFPYQPQTKYLPQSQPYLQTDQVNDLWGKQQVPTEETPGNAVPYTGAPSQDIDRYKVAYKGPKSSQRYNEEADREKRTILSRCTSPKRTIKETQYDDLQEEFLNTGSNHQVEQLQILYAARGRKLEEVTEQLKTLKDDSDREIRILKHKLTLAQGERDGLSISLDQCQQMVKESRERETELQSQVKASESQIEALKTAKQQLIKKLQAHESTIESLNAQLINLEASESLSRAREQHEAIVADIKEKHQHEIYLLKEKLDKAEQTIQDKDQEIENLRKQVTMLLKHSEDVQINRADTVNQLARSLEDSQRQCQQLLEAGQGHELSKLKLQLQEVIASKSITEDMNNALQEEIRELKEQVMMYESVSQFGIFSATASSGSMAKTAPGFDDSYAQLGIRTSENKMQPPAWQTPESNRSENSTLSSEDTVHALKAELERCLLMYKKKREQVTELQEKQKSLHVTLEDYKTRLTKSEEEIKQYKDKLKSIEDKFGDCLTASNPREAFAKRELESIIKERDMLAAELEEVKTRLHETATNEEKVLELNQELRTQMSQMIHEFDEDKRQALEKCQEAVLQHHEEVLQRREKDITEKFMMEKAELEKEWQAKYDELINQLSAVQKELNEVKNLYITVCKEKDQLEERLREEYDKKLQEHINNLKAQSAEEKQEELERVLSTKKEQWTKEIEEMIVKRTKDELKVQFEKEKQEELERILAIKKEEWKKEEEDVIAKAVESEVTARKAQWFEEHQMLRDQAVERALKVNNLEWQQKWDSELYKQIEEELNKVQENWNNKTEAEFQRRLEERLSSAKQLWLDTELVNAKETWRNTELQEALEQARQQAVKEAEERLKEVHTKMIAQALADARKQWESEKRSSADNKDSNLERLHELEQQCESLKLKLDELKSEKMAIQQELSKNDAVWQQEKAELIRQKETEKREAVLEVQQQIEVEYKEFLSEHQDTLNKALSNAREQYRFEKEALKQQYEAELEALRQNQSASTDVEEKLENERKKLLEHWEMQLATVTSEHKKLHDQWEAHLNEQIAEHEKSKEQWEAHLASVVADHEEEKQQLLLLHRENMAKALDEAQSRWQKKLENILQQTERTALLEREKEWEEERAHYLAIIEEREQLLQTADEHMETEIAKLQEQLEKQLQQQHREASTSDHSTTRDDGCRYQSGIKAGFNDHLQNAIQALEDSLNAHHEQDLSAEMKKLQETHERELKSIEDELHTKYQEEMQSKVEEVRAQMNDVLEHERLKLRDEMEKKIAECMAASRAEMEKVLTKLEDTRKQLKDLYGKYTKDTKNLAKKNEILCNQLKNAQKSVEEYQLKIRELENENESLKATVDGLNRQLEKAEKLRQEIVESLKRSEKEHEEIINSYKSRCTQMAEKIQQVQSQLNTVKAEAHEQLINMQQSMEREHNMAVENLKVKLVEINQKHDDSIKQLQAQHDCEKERLLQELSQKDDCTIYDMRDQYLEAVEKIREDVLKHLNQSTEQAAVTLQVQVMKERQVTARRLRRYYMKCLAHMLEKDCDPVAKEHKLSAMERYLDSLPERDNSRSTTPSVPSIDSASKPSTPVSTTQVAADPSTSYEMFNSSNASSDSFKKKQSKHSLAANHSEMLSCMPPSADDDCRNLWITSRSQTNTLSSMTYPMPSLKNGSPSNGSNGLPPTVGDQKMENRKSYNRKSLEQQIKGLRSQYSSTFDQGLSASTPNLTPRQVGFSKVPDEVDSEMTREKQPQRSDWYTLPRSIASNESYLMYSSESRPSPYREQSPVDDILNKYAIVPLPQGTMTAEDAHLPDSTQSTPGKHLKMPSVDRNNIFRARSTEFLHRDLQLASSDASQPSAVGYKYTSLRGTLSARGHSRSSSQLHTFQTDTNSKPQLHTGLLPREPPPERIPAPKQATPPRPSFVPRLQLRSLDIDMNQSDILQSVNSFADDEVTKPIKQRGWNES